MEHPPKQGLKLSGSAISRTSCKSFNGTSTKTRIETFPKKGLDVGIKIGFNGTSTKTRIET